MKNKRFKIGGCLCLVYLLATGCEDFLKREIEVNVADSSPKVTVTATLEDSLFYIHLGLSNPITSLPTLPSGEISEALIKLYEDDTEILKITKPAPMNEDMYFDYIPESDWKYPFFAITDDVRVTPGKTYRLEVVVEGYPPVSSIVVAPDVVDISYAYVSQYATVSKAPNSVGVVVDGTGITGGCGEYYQLNLGINDNPHAKDYYIIEAYDYSNQMRFGLDVATSERALIQDNPDIMANQWLEETDITTFAFRQMILSDLTFRGTTNDLNLLLSACSIYSHYRKDLHISVKRINHESYHYYRTFALQQINIDFFSEPVSLISNIEGGYGCFSVITKTMKKLSIR